MEDQLFRWFTWILAFVAAVYLTSHFLVSQICGR